MENSNTIPSASEMVHRYQNRRKTKRFGQHFLTDPNILDHIIELSKTPEGESILEIGPGCGTLSVAMLKQGYSVTAIELDRDLCAFLRRQNLANFQLIEGDAVKLNLADLQPKYVIANLPYNASTRILFKLLRIPFEGLTLMFQKEVAVRICSEPHCKAYGSLSVLSQLLSEPRIVMNLPPGAFAPPPKVDSAVVHFVPRHVIQDEELDAFEKFVRAAFATRRKKVVNNLRHFFPKEDILRTLEFLELDPLIRAENISPEMFFKLFFALKKQ